MTDFALARFVQAPNGAEAVNRGINQGLSTFLNMEQAKVAPELNQERLKSAKINNELAPFLAGERLQGARLNNELRAARIDSLNGEERAREEAAVKQGLVREIDFVLRGGPETERQARYAQSLGRVRQVIPGLQLPDNFDDQTRLILEKARVDLGGDVVEQPGPVSSVGKQNLDVERGFATAEEIAASRKPKPPVSIGINTGKQGEELGKLFATRFVQLADASQNSVTQDAQLDRLSALVKNTPTGSVIDATHGLRAFAGGLGLDLGGNIPAEEAINQIGTTFVLDQIGKTKGAVSDKETAMFARSAPGLARTREGNLLMISFLKKMNEAARRNYGQAVEFYRQSGGTWGPEQQLALTEFQEQNPVFDDVDIELLQDFAGQ